MRFKIFSLAVWKFTPISKSDSRWNEIWLEISLATALLISYPSAVSSEVEIFTIVQPTPQPRVIITPDAPSYDKGITAPSLPIQYYVMAFSVYHNRCNIV